MPRIKSRLEKFIRKNFNKFLFDVSEGYVITLQNGNMYKILSNEKDFKKANYYSYWLKFNIVGGRRPKKPSFLRRTQNWSTEERLARLEKLRNRYIRNRNRLTRTYGPYTVSYSDDLNIRMLAMFNDTKNRIENGR